MPGFDGKRSFEFLKQLSFPRLSATKNENRAAEIIKQTLKKAGLTCKTETFREPTYTNTAASLEVVAPYKKTYPAVEVGFSGNTPKKGLSAGLAVLDAQNHFALQNAKGKIVMLYRLLLNDVYGKFKKYKIPGFIRVSDPDGHLAHLRVNQKLVKKHGKFPGLAIDYETAMELIHKKAEKIRLHVRMNEFLGTSYNITTTIKGTAYPDEVIFVCAHYDSVEKCPGAQDNAAGAVSIMEFARHLKENPPMRTVILAWFASEEIGLRGSFNYAKRHVKDLKKVKLVLNMDVGGAILGSNGSTICGSKSLENYVTALCKEKGIHATVQHGAYSSDNIPFNTYGIPSVALYRSGGIYGHTPKDESRLIDGEHLKMIGDLGLEFLTRTANAIELPFTLDIEEKDKKAVAEYVKNGKYKPILPGKEKKKT